MSANDDLFTDAALLSERLREAKELLLEVYSHHNSFHMQHDESDNSGRCNWCERVRKLLKINSENKAQKDP